MENLHKKFEPWVQTWTGVQFTLLDPKPEQVNVFDIAHALSNMCRFMGHMKTFYSVAQHSVLVSRYCAPEDALWGLLHDGTEAYVADMAKPLKQQAVMAGYCALEDRLSHVIKDALNLPELPEGKHMPDSVKEADVRMLFTEKRDLMSPCDWGFEVEPYAERIAPVAPGVARRMFLDRYFELTGVGPEGHLRTGFLDLLDRASMDDAVLWAQTAVLLGLKR